MFGASIGRGAGRIIGAMVQGLARRSINPNVLTVIGVFLSDLALSALDPRIRLEGGASR